MFLDEIVNLSYFDQFNHVIVSDTTIRLPKSVTRITFSDNFDESVENYLPDTVTHITFGLLFDRPIHTMPKAIVYVAFGEIFCQPIDCVPDSIKFIWLHIDYSLCIPDRLLSKVKLYLG